MNRLVKLENLDTSFVNLGALIRHLRQRNFVGRVKVALEEYEADVFLYGAEEPSIWEKNHATGRGAQGRDAMERLLVRAREPGGMITIYEGPKETGSANDKSPGSSETAVVAEAHESAGSSMGHVPAALTVEVDWDELIVASGELIAAVERAAQSANEDFVAHFRSALVALGDDYPFLDPTLGGFQYCNAKVQLRERPAASDFVSSLTEGLRRTVSKLADGKAGARFRERVAVELAVVARRNENAYAQFTPHLDRIAGTRVL
ncbi:MAG: hypothetical protein H7Z16_17690 [Pyrinomonadaceae bacterium]|nr:hypothetical protein [Pyrinomonadaceae bacterium]